MKARLHDIDPGTIMGYRKPRTGEVGPQPIFPIAGAAEDDDIETDMGSGDTAGDDEDDDTDGDDDDADDKDDKDKKKDKEPDWVPPSKEEYERLKATAAARLREKRDLKTQLNAAKGTVRGKTTVKKAADKPADKAGDAGSGPSAEELEDTRAELEAERKNSSSWKQGAITNAAKVALVGADARPERLVALSRLLKMDELDLDSNHEIEGMDEQIDELKELYPEFFLSDEDKEPPSRESDKNKARTGSTARRSRTDAGDKGREGRKPLTSAEKVAKGLLGG